MKPLWDHQIKGLDLLRQRDALMLAWEMGTAKTRVVVEYVCRHRPPTVLVVCPKTVMPVWLAEFKKWSRLRRDCVVVAPTNGSLVKRAAAVVEAGRDAESIGNGIPCVVIVNYEAVWREPFRSASFNSDWDLVVLDESHRAKDPASRVSRYLGQLTRKAKKRVCLTGTPMPHSPLDVWSQFRFLDPKVFGESYHAFRHRHVVLGGYKVRGKPVQVLGYRNLEWLNKKFYRIADRVVKADVLDLPSTVHVEHPVHLGRQCRRTYDELEQALRAEVDGGTVTAANGAVKLMRLQQATSGFAKLDHSEVETVIDKAKIDALTEILGGLNEKKNVVVFCRFVRDVNRVKECAEANGRPGFQLRGGVNELDEWKAEPGAVLATQIQTGGMGVDMTVASTAVYYSQTLSLGEYDQSLARLHRAGQENKVTYIHLLASKTVDWAVRKAQQQRKKIIEHVLQELSTDDERRRPDRSRTICNSDRPQT